VFCGGDNRARTCDPLRVEQDNGTFDTRMEH